MTHTYMGERDRQGTALVFRDGLTFSPARSLKVRNHSPNGFEWGYGGSGPAQLALALLLDVAGNKETALDYYQQFKWEVVGKMPDRGWVISSREIEDWLIKAIDTDVVNLNGVPTQ